MLLNQQQKCEKKDSTRIADFFIIKPLPWLGWIRPFANVNAKFIDQDADKQYQNSYKSRNI